MENPRNIWIIILILILIFFPGDVLSSWMWLGVASVGVSYPSSTTDLLPASNRSESTERPPTIRRRPRPFDTSSPRFCRKVPGLVRSQRKLCERSRDVFLSISEGAKLAIDECQRQFQSERWNCSTDISLENPFGKIIDLGTRETGFTYAITSAGVVHAVARACSSGNITDCACHVPDGRPGAPDSDVREWRWGGCSDNVLYATRIARKFVDASERTEEEKRILKSYMNLHNNELGRQSIERQMKLKCRCHGPSSSCSLKTCWETMPDMKKIGDFIKDKYEQSIQVTYKKKKGKLKPKVRLGRGSIKRDTMVFIHWSPNFCSYNPEHGALGTRGRECNRTDYYGQNSCESLCCGRGYNVQEVRTVDTKCNCQFVWCCKVNCQTCEYVREISTCK